MSAERLREAAKVLRERAEAATPGPWVDECSGPTGPVVMDSDSCNALDHIAKCGHYRARLDAAYIATMHPGVGLALADWLDYEAGRVDTAVDDGWDARIFKDALRIADLILGDAS